MNTENLYAALVTAQKGARARLLNRGDVDIAVAAYGRGVALAARLGVDPSTVCVQSDGGSVGKSYGARADRTLLTIAHGVARIVRDKAPENGRSGGALILSMDFPADLKTGGELPPHSIVEGGTASVGRKFSGRACWK